MPGECAVNRIYTRALAGTVGVRPAVRDMTGRKPVATPFVPAVTKPSARKAAPVLAGVEADGARLPVVCVSAAPERVSRAELNGVAGVGRGCGRRCVRRLTVLRRANTSVFRP